MKIKEGRKKTEKNKNKKREEKIREIMERGKGKIRGVEERKVRTTV